MGDATTLEALEVTQADREAVRVIYRLVREERDSEAYLAAARHRLATLAAQEARIAALEGQVAAYRLLAVNEGWVHRMVDACGYTEYAAFRIAEVDDKARRTIASGYDAIGWLRHRARAALQSENGNG